MAISQNAGPRPAGEKTADSRGSLSLFAGLLGEAGLFAALQLRV